VHNRRSENDELHRLDCLDFFGNNPLREAWQLAGKLVVGYSGNLGRAHDFQTVLAAAERLRNEKRIVF
jgi:hypothetical protein